MPSSDPPLQSLDPPAIFLALERRHDCPSRTLSRLLSISWIKIRKLESPAADWRIQMERRNDRLFDFCRRLESSREISKIGLVTRLLNRWVVAPPPIVDHAFETDWVSGASMIIRRKVLEDVGVLDEGYYTYFDDIDYCFNARKHGWPTWYVPTSRVVHLVGQTTGVNRQPKRMPSYLLDARRRYFLKNHGPLYAAMVDAGMIVGLSLNRLRVMLTGKADNTAPHVLQDAIRHSVFLKGFRLQDVQNPALAAPTV